MSGALQRLTESRVLRIAVALALVLSYVQGFAAPQGGTQAYADVLVPSQVSLKYSRKIVYDNFTTRDFTTDGTAAYCANPNLDAPDGGTYATTSPAVSDYWRDSMVETRTEQLRAILWFGYGGPGFDSSMFPSTWYDGTAMTADRYRALTHIAVSFVWTMNTTQAAHGTSEEFEEYVRVYVTGLVDGVLTYTDAFVRQAWRAMDELPSTEVFQTYMIAGGSFQTIVSFVYQAPGYLSIVKGSSNTAITSGNGAYSLAGAVFQVYDEDGALVGTLTTNSKGRTSALELPVGTYTVKEVLAPEGYYLSTSTWSVSVQSGVTELLEVLDEPASDRVELLVYKFDAETGGKAQGSAGLAGAEFTIEYYDTLDYGSYDSLVAAGVTPTRTWVLMTDASGVAYLSKDFFVSGDELYYDSNGNAVIPRGSIAVYESKAPAGYLLNPEVSFQKIQEEPAKNVVTYNLVEVGEQVIRGGVEVYKRDMESERSSPLGAATLDGARFEVVSRNEGEVVVNGASYGTGEVVASLVIEDGYAASATDLLPYGNYALREVSAGEGYLVDGTEYTFSIEEDGALVNPAAQSSDGHVHNRVRRGDFELTKRADNGSAALAGVAFKVTSVSTGESHVAVTDENGSFSSASSWNPHSQNTNGNDWVLEVSGTIDSSLLDAEAGIWFGLDQDGSTTEVDDSLGALPYDVYKIEELRSTANEGYVLVSTTVTIRRDGVVVDLGTLIDPEAELVTVATDAADGDALIGVGAVTMSDRVGYSHLVAGQTYTLEAGLYDAETGEAIEVDGKAVTGSTTFVAQDSYGVAFVELELETYDLMGKTLVVFEKLLDAGGAVLAEHADVRDTDQQVEVLVPELATTALDGIDGDKHVVADTASVIVDTVSYRNLTPGETYTVRGTLMLKGYDGEGSAVGQELLVEGQSVVASAEFTAEAAEGSVEVIYEFDATGLEEGTEIVVFESLFLDGHEIATHADIDDESQTVTVTRPQIDTEATDGHDGDKIVVADSVVRIVDTVSFENLVPGKEYVLTGSLMLKSYDEEGNAVGQELFVPSGEAGLEVGDAEVAVSATTTFVPEQLQGTVEVVFEFDASLVSEGTEVVVFESLTRDGVEVAVHADIHDESQTVAFVRPSISSTASDASDGDKTVVADTDARIVDAVFYEGLITDEEHTMVGIVVDASTGLPLLDQGEDWDEEELTAFTLTLLSAFGAPEAELGEEASSTTALSAGMPATSLPTEVDMQVLATLLEEHEELLDSLVAASASFTPEGYEGEVTLEFSLDASTLIDPSCGETVEAVVYEFLFRGSFEGDEAPVLVAFEANANNADQTVIITPASISTTASDAADGDSELAPSAEVAVKDSVFYTGLVSGKEYILRATLYDKSTGEPLSLSGVQVTSELRFTPNTESGIVAIEIGSFDASALGGRDLVVFEELWLPASTDGVPTEILVAEHKDLADEGQTVSVAQSLAFGFYGKTGGTLVGMVVVAAALVLTALGAMYLSRTFVPRSQGYPVVTANGVIMCGVRPPGQRRPLRHTLRKARNIALYHLRRE